MRYMFTMMNNARLSVGARGPGPRPSGPTSRRSQYAQERQQGRRPAAPRPASTSSIIEHPDVRRMLLTMKALHRGHAGARSTCNAAAPSTSPSTTPTPTCAQRGPGAGRRCSRRSRRRGGTDLGVEVTSLAIQVHGGMGYIEETGRRPALPRRPHRRRSTRAPTASRPSTSSAASCRCAGGAVVRRPADATIAALDAELGRGRRRAGRRSARTSPRPLAVADRHDRRGSCEHGVADRATRWPGRRPYLRMFGLRRRRLAAGPAGARRQAPDLDAGGGFDAEFLRGQDRHRPLLRRPAAARRSAACSAPVTAGSADLYAIEPRSTWPADG